MNKISYRIGRLKLLTYVNKLVLLVLSGADAPNNFFSASCEAKGKGYNGSVD